MEQISFRQERDFGEIISDTFTFLRQNFKPLLMNLLTIAGPFVFFQVVTGTVAQAMRGTDDTASAFLNLINIILSVVATALLFSTVYSYILLYIHQHGVPKASIVRNHSTTNFRMVLKTMFGSGLAIFLGSIVLVLPGIYLLVAISPIVILRINERIDTSDAISRCTRLTRGYWWQTLGLLIVAGFMLIILSAPFSLPVIFLQTFIFQSNADTALSTLQIFAMVLIAVLSFCMSFLYVVPMVTVALQYFNLVERKEATGLMERVEQMNTSLTETISA